VNKSMILEANVGSPIRFSVCNIPVPTTAKPVKMDLEYLSSSSYEPRHIAIPFSY